MQSYNLIHICLPINNDSSKLINKTIIIFADSKEL